MILPTLEHPLSQHANLRRLVSMRSIAITSELLVMVAAHWWLDINLPETSLLVIISALFGWNIWTVWRMQQATPTTDIEIFIQLFVDVCALSGILYFSGGATNPFVSFYLPAIAVAAAILPWRFSVALSLFSLLSYSFMTSTYVPLHVLDHDRAMTYHLTGMWINFVVSAALITWFVARMSGALRERDAELALAREHYLQNERIVALGTQAASAAHEMGTPLATVAIITHELRREAESIPELSAYTEDLALIESQINQCKKALDQMYLHTHESDADSSPVMLNEWLKLLLNTWRIRHPMARILLSIPERPAATITHSKAIASILLILLDNAAQATPQDRNEPIYLGLNIQTSTITIQIKNTGPTIHADLLKRLGYEPVPSTTGGQGIGLMLAFNTARQIGAKIELSSLPPQDICAVFTFPRFNALIEPPLSS